MDTILNWMNGSWNWWNVERVKTLAALIQASGFVAAAYLAYQFARKLEGDKFNMRLEEIAHANTHKRRMEGMEKIAGLMGKVITKLELVPEFIDYFELNPMPPEELEGLDPDEQDKRRFMFRHKEFYQALFELMEAAETGCIYIDETFLTKIENFVAGTRSLLQQYNLDYYSNPPFSKFEAMGKFKEEAKKLRELRRDITVEFNKQLRK